MLKYLKVIEEETKRCGDIVKGLLDFTSKDQLDYKTSHLNKVLRETYTLMDHQMKMANIAFFTDFSASRDLINCNENQIKQACIAILINAAYSCDSGHLILT
jgi:two-component system NtrC family sensor kinase